MSLKYNILANYVGNIYVTLVGIVMVPVYIDYIGIEAYGLVGFYALLQGWFALLDAGLSPTMGRETARFTGGVVSALSLRMLLRTLEGIFIVIALLGTLSLIFNSSLIATHWLNVQTLPLEDVQNSIKLIAIIIGLRWTCALYRSTIYGFERLVWLNIFNCIISTIKSIFVISYFIYVSHTIIDFFLFQLGVAFLELIVLMIQAYRLMPVVKSEDIISWQWSPLQKVLKFTLSVAFTRVVWVMITQTDKLLLSKLLPLSEYAYFTLAVLLASGIRILGTPITSALFPRMAKLNAEKDDKQLIQLYRNMTQLTCVITIPATLMLAFFSEKIIWVWTGNIEIAHHVAPILKIYVLGSGILALGAFPHCLQWAKGDLKLHVIGNVLFLILLTPSLIWATMQYGVMGAAYSWLGINMIYFLVLTPLVHKKFVKGLHKRWLFNDVLGIAFICFLYIFLAHLWIQWPEDRLLVTLLIFLLGSILIFIAGMSSSYLRGIAIIRLKKYFSN
jgi:O-antigen/teichoic acid export membrane protein